MRLSAERLQAAIRILGWTPLELDRRLKANGLDVGGPRIIQKLLKGKQQPSADKIELIQQVVGYKVTQDPPRRRRFGDPISPPQMITA